jgi:hypothetical protein
MIEPVKKILKLTCFSAESFTYAGILKRLTAVFTVPQFSLAISPLDVALIATAESFCPTSTW